MANLPRHQKIKSFYQSSPVQPSVSVILNTVMFSKLLHFEMLHFFHALYIGNCNNLQKAHLQKVHFLQISSFLPFAFSAAKRSGMKNFETFTNFPSRDTNVEAHRSFNTFFIRGTFYMDMKEHSNHMSNVWMCNLKNSIQCSPFYNLHRRLEHVF